MEYAKCTGDVNTTRVTPGLNISNRVHISFNTHVEPREMTKTYYRPHMCQTYVFEYFGTSVLETTTYYSKSCGIIRIVIPSASLAVEQIKN